jgi:hypothetical protein
VAPKPRATAPVTQRSPYSAAIATKASSQQAPGVIEEQPTGHQGGRHSPWSSRRSSSLAIAMSSRCLSRCTNLTEPAALRAQTMSPSTRYSPWRRIRSPRSLHNAPVASHSLATAGTATIGLVSLPELLEAIGRQLSIARGVLDVLVAKVRLQGRDREAPTPIAPDGPALTQRSPWAI